MKSDRKRHKAKDQELIERAALLFAELFYNQVMEERRQKEKDGNVDSPPEKS